MEYIRGELKELEEKETGFPDRKKLYIGGDGSGIGDLETGIAALYRKRKILEFVITTALIFGIGGALAVAGITKSLITAMVIGVIGVAAGVGAYLVRLRVSEEIEKKDGRKTVFLHGRRNCPGAEKISERPGKKKRQLWKMLRQSTGKQKSMYIFLLQKKWR